MLLAPFLSCAEGSSSKSKAEVDMTGVKTEIWKIGSHGEIFTYISPKISAGEKVPLVLAMNCTTGNPEAEVLTNGWLSLCAEEKLIVVALASECPKKITAISAAGWMIGARKTSHGFLVPFQVLQGTREYTERNAGGNMEIMDDEKIAVRDLFTMNKMKRGNPDYSRTPFWGYAADRTYEIFPEYTDYDPYGNNAEKKSGVRWTVSDFYKEGYKNPFAEFVLIDGAAHIPHSYHAKIAWEFFSHFSRNENGEIVEE